MGPETPLEMFPRARLEDEPVNALFTFEVVRQARIVTRLVGFEADAQRVRVSAEIYPVDVPETNEPQRRFYDFPNRQKAQEFADEAVLALEYLGCTVRDAGGSPGRVLAGVPAEGAAVG